MVTQRSFVGSTSKPQVLHSALPPNHRAKTARSGTDPGRFARGMTSQSLICSQPCGAGRCGGVDAIGGVELADGFRRLGLTQSR